MSVYAENQRRHNHGGHEYTSRCVFCKAFLPNREFVMCEKCGKPVRNYQG